MRQLYKKGYGEGTEMPNLDKFLNGLVLVDGYIFLNQINFILKDYDMLETHNFNSSKMLRSLWLGAALICSYEK